MRKRHKRNKNDARSCKLPVWVSNEIIQNKTQEIIIIILNSFNYNHIYFIVQLNFLKMYFIIVNFNEIELLTRQT